MCKMLSNKEILIRRKLKDDFSYYAPRCLQIVDKGGDFVPFVMNSAQQYIHTKIEEQYKETGKVRAILLKGRQQGVSTYVQARYLWKTTHNKGKKAFILTHATSATQSLYSMTKRYYYNLPPVVRPAINKNNASELEFHNLDSGYRVSTAGSSGVGRGSTIHYFHGSEVAFWTNGEQHITGVLQAISDNVGTEIILESTSDGPKGLFHKMCKDAYDNKNDYQLIFVPWFWQEEYRAKASIDFTLTPEEKTYAEQYDLDIEQMFWRRNKINTFVRGIEDFRREYPATYEEAFQAESENALWTRKDFKTISQVKFDHIKDSTDDIQTIIAFDPAGTSNENSDESGVIIASLIEDKVYVFHDSSGRYKPDEVVTYITQLYHLYDCDRLTIETNYGGDWIPSTFRNEDPNVVIHTVHARKGKKLRAEPIAHAYRQGRIIHVGDLSLLESELTTWNPYDSKAPSPNRLDAVVYAITDLLDIAQKQDTPVAWGF